MNLNNWTKALLVVLFICVSGIGFLVKLPSGFRHIDKELHAAFYFFAAAFLNLLFSKRNILRHVIIFIALYLFGLGIEFVQEYSNKFFRSRIHGRFDIEDVQANLKGLVLFSITWVAISISIFIYNKLRLVKPEKVKN